MQTPAPSQQPPAQTPPSQGGQPSPGTTGTTGQTTGGSTSTTTTAGDPGRQWNTAPSPDLLPSIVELDSLVDIEVTYRPEAGAGIWMPAKMAELYEAPIPRGTRAPLRGRTVAEATYSSFKRFETPVRIVVPKVGSQHGMRSGRSIGPRSGRPAAAGRPRA